MDGGDGRRSAAGLSSGEVAGGVEMSVVAPVMRRAGSPPRRRDAAATGASLSRSDNSADENISNRRGRGDLPALRPTGRVAAGAATAMKVLPIVNMVDERSSMLSEWFGERFPSRSREPRHENADWTSDDESSANCRSNRRSRGDLGFWISRVKIEGCPRFLHRALSVRKLCFRVIGETSSGARHAERSPLPASKRTGKPCETRKGPRARPRSSVHWGARRDDGSAGAVP